MNAGPQSRPAPHPRRVARLAWSLAVAGALAIVPAARAQVFMNAQPVPLPSAYPADWAATHSLVRLLMTNSAGEPVRCDLRVLIEQNGSTATVTVPRQFNVGPTFLTTPQVTNWSRLAYTGAMKKAMDRTGHLPASPIAITLFCENMFGMVTNNPIPPVQATIVIIPSVPPPPTLLTPSDASQLRSTQPVFTWTPVRLTTGEEVWYQFRLVRVLPNQTPTRALEANYAVLETFVHQSNFAYPPEAPRLEDGGVYAWRVQALVNASTDIHDVPAPGNYSHLGLNDGRSRIYSFVSQKPSNGDEASAATASRRADGRLGSMIGIGTDDRGTPVARNADSLTLASIQPTPSRWWGPRSGGRVETAGSATVATDGGDATTGSDGAASDGATGDPATGMAVATPAAVAPRRAPIQVDTGTPTGQGFGTPWLRVSGTSIAAGELYSHTGAGVPSRPDNNGQVMAGVTLSTLDDKLHIPLQALVSGDQVSFRQGINRIAVHPEWRWGGLHAGTINPGFSSFSLADATLQGGGADVVRGRWYASAVDGRMQKAIQPDNINAVEAQYARNVMAGRIGFGSPLGNAVEIEVMRARDDTGSLTSEDSLVRVAPAGNTVFGGRVRHTVLDSLTTVQVEGAWSRYDRNLKADVPVVNGGAGGIRITRRSMLGEVGAAFDYVGGGFITLCNSELAPDRMEGRLNGRRDLFAGKLRVGGNVGLRRDDLSGTLGGATNRRMLGAQVGWQPTTVFGSDVDVQVLSSRSPGTDLRGTFKEVTTAFTFSPHLSWTWLGSQHTLTSSVSVQSTEFSDVGAIGFPNSHNTMVVSGWQSSVTQSLFVNLSGNYVRSETGGFTSETGSVGPGLSWVLFGGRAQTNLQLQVMQTHVQGFGTDRDVAPNIDLRYLVTGHQMLMFRAGMRRFRTPAAAAGNFDEHLATLQYSAAL